MEFLVLLVRGSVEHHRLYQKGACWGQKLSSAPTKAVCRDEDIESL